VDVSASLGAFTSPDISYKLPCTLADGLPSSDSSDSWKCFNLLCRIGPEQCDAVGPGWPTISSNPPQDFNAKEQPAFDSKLKHAGVVHDIAAHNREYRANFFQRLVGDGEVVVTEHDKIGQLARLDGSDLILFPQEPTVVGCV
jgi:hypothetical protein